MALPYKTIIMSCENTVKNISLYCCHIGRCLFSHIYPFWNCYIQTSKIDDMDLVPVEVKALWDYVVRVKLSWKWTVVLF